MEFKKIIYKKINIIMIAIMILIFIITGIPKISNITENNGLIGKICVNELGDNEINKNNYKDFYLSLEEEQKDIDLSKGLTDEQDASLKIVSDLRFYNMAIEYREMVLRQIENADNNDKYRKRVNNYLKRNFSDNLSFKEEGIGDTRTIIELLNGDLYSDIIALLCIICIVGQIFISEYTNYNYLLTKTTYFGIKKVYKRKIFVAALIGGTVGIIQTLCAVLIVVIKGNVGGLLMPIQVVSGFELCPYNISIGETILIFALLKIMSYSIIAVILSQISIFFKKDIFYIMTSVILIGSMYWIMNYNRMYSEETIIESRYEMFEKIRKYMIVAIVGAPSSYIKKFKTVNIFNLPVNYAVLNIFVNLIILSICIIIGYNVYCGNRRKIFIKKVKGEKLVC